MSLAAPRGVRRIDVQSARDMFAAAQPEAERADVFIATAAVAKWEGQLTLEDQSLDRGIGTTPLPAE